MDQTAGNKLVIVEQAPSVVELPSLRDPCPLYCVAHPHHTSTHYKWSTIPDDGQVFVDTSVIFVSKCGCYTCEVSLDGRSVESNSIVVR